MYISVGNTNPKHNFDVDAAGGARIFQLKPLVHGEFMGCQNTGQWDCQTAQGQSAVIIFHLNDKYRKKRCGECE